MLILLASLSLAAEYASDVVSEVDVVVASKEVKVTFAVASHATVTRAQANDLRTAYVGSGWSALRTAWVAIDSRAGGWLDAMTQAERDALIYQVSSRSALPAVP